ncbi:hypothetical protein FGO68_gene4370 [Halteria grandinella]|uniref:Uncharacterized protein n=1 Tax=Halteria grandinella TaxID=5974 RepID=A0A8J8T625_HALGN|nr:hypothetical protein FGO68_gene4370 [Halteria grandinella]
MESQRTNKKYRVLKGKTLDIRKEIKKTKSKKRPEIRKRSYQRFDYYDDEEIYGSRYPSRFDYCRPPGLPDWVDNETLALNMMGWDKEDRDYGLIDAYFQGQLNDYDDSY